jgi:hypothetical protein
VGSSDNFQVFYLMLQRSLQLLGHAVAAVATVATVASVASFATALALLLFNFKVLNGYFFVLRLENDNNVS